MGCRNVSKLLVPENYKFDNLYEQIQPFDAYCLHHHKYFNNYEYNKSIVLINRVPHFDNGFLLFEENPALVSPLSMVYYQTYSDQEEVSDFLTANADKIQCTVGKPLPGGFTVPFGQAQHPSIDDYADGVDTMKFLTVL